MSKAKIYISGKISGLPDLGRQKFEDAKWQLVARYGSEAIILNPHDLPAEHDKSWHSYMKVCIRVLVDCTAVSALQDWRKSRGAIIEVIIATFLAIPVYHHAELVKGNYHGRIKITLSDMLRMFCKVLLNRF